MEGRTGGAVADGPHGLFLDLLVVLEEDLNKFVNDAQVEALLDLFDRACRDVRQSPTNLLPDRLLLAVN